MNYVIKWLSTLYSNKTVFFFFLLFSPHQTPPPKSKFVIPENWLIFFSNPGLYKCSFVAFWLLISLEMLMGWEQWAFINICDTQRIVFNSHNCPIEILILQVRKQRLKDIINNNEKKEHFECSLCKKHCAKDFLILSFQ